MKHGVLLLNFGGPETLSDVRPFLFRLFCDRNILVGIPAPFRQMVALAIALIKGPASRRAYAAIGGGSPQLKWTRIQAESLSEMLRKSVDLHAQCDAVIEYKIAIGMRSSAPGIRKGLTELKEWGADTVTLLPLFPQFSTTTSGSCLEAAKVALDRLNWRPNVREIKSWPDHPRYVAALRAVLDRSIEEAEKRHERKPYVLFSAHSLPLEVVRRGDPYPAEIRRTIAAITNGLRHRFSMAFQSRNGKRPWLEPYIENELERLGREGVKNLVVCPISFVSDHIETLWELDLLYAEHAGRQGIEAYTRVPTFNGDLRFVEVLHEIVKEGVL